MLDTPGFIWGVLGTRFGSLEFQIGSLESEKIIIGSLKSENVGPENRRNRVSTDPYRVHNIFLKITLIYTPGIFFQSFFAVGFHSPERHTTWFNRLLPGFSTCEPQKNFDWSRPGINETDHVLLVETFLIKT